MSQKFLGFSLKYMINPQPNIKRILGNPTDELEEGLEESEGKTQHKTSHRIT